MTAGPWRPIRLETYTYRIEDVRIDSDLIGPEYKTATLKASVELASSTKSTDGLEYKASVELASSTKSTDGLEYKAVLKTLEGKKVKEATFGLEESIDWTFAKGEVEAWFPIHYGKQPLYTLEIILRDKVRLVSL
jgi:beta-mannosidase